MAKDKNGYDTLTVTELINELKKMPPDVFVYHELEWALTKMERAITRWETATQQINQAFELMGEATEHLLNLAEDSDNALGSAAHGRVSTLVKLMHNKILCHDRAVKAATAKQLYGLKPVGRVIHGG